MLLAMAMSSGFVFMAGKRVKRKEERNETRSIFVTKGKILSNAAAWLSKEVAMYGGFSFRAKRRSRADRSSSCTSCLDWIAVITLSAEVGGGTKESSQVVVSAEHLERIKATLSASDSKRYYPLRATASLARKSAKTGGSRDLSKMGTAS